jgi:hypothetical protein
MLVAGLLATLAVTVYVTRLARRALKDQTEIAPDEDLRRAAGVNRLVDPGHSPEDRSKPRGRPWGATITAAIAFMFMLSAGFSQFKPNLFQHLFGGILPPPRVTLQEAYEEKPDGPSFDHSALDRLLKAHVDPEGWVNYQGLKADADELNAYLRAIANAPFDEMGRKQKLALLINAYNAFTLRLILDYYPVASIKDISEDKRWNDERWQVGGHRWSLMQIENEEIRPKFIEPRVHFALVCAAIGCPKLRNEAYQPDRLEQQLDDQARYVHSHRRWFRFDPGDGILHLTQLYLGATDRINPPEQAGP